MTGTEGELAAGELSIGETTVDKLMTIGAEIGTRLSLGLADVLRSCSVNLLGCPALSYLRRGSVWKDLTFLIYETMQCALLLLTTM